jgi:hypothetical protein
LPDDPHAASATAQASATHTERKAFFISCAMSTPPEITPL